MDKREKAARLLREAEDEELYQYSGASYKGFTLNRYPHKKSFVWKAAQSINNKKYIVYIGKTPHEWEKKIDQKINDEGISDLIQKKITR